MGLESAAGGCLKVISVLSSQFQKVVSSIDLDLTGGGQGVLGSSQLPLEDQECPGNPLKAEQVVPGESGSAQKIIGLLYLS